MSGFFALLHFAALVCFIVFLIKMIKRKKSGEDYSQPKKIMLISIAVWFVALILIGVTTPSSKSTEVAETENITEESTTAELPAETSTDTTEVQEENKTPEVADFEVTVDVNAHKDGNSVVFDIETNMPDETVLMLTLSNGDYNTDNAFTAQTKVTVTDGKATSEGFSNKGEALSGDFDLSISMSLPSLQSDAVRAVIGENGEHMQGNLVETSTVGSSNTIKAMFNVSLGDEITVTATDDYNNTIFREEGEEEETEITDTSDSGSDSAANKEFISKYETDIVVAAKMSLDNFISDYKLSLAPQNWTIAKFDSSETTVIAMSDITYNSVKGTYIYVGTLNINSSGKVESATPHYLEVNGVVLGDDGYCDDVFDKIRSLGN